LSLSGLRIRDSGPSPTRPPPPARVDPPKGIGPKGVRGEPASALGGLGFVAEPGGRAVRDDPALPFVATIEPDGRIEFRHRALGAFKYYALKTAIQKDTFALRLAMVRRWSRRKTKARLGALGGELRAAWSKPIEAAARRRLLFELWDDCLERPEDSEQADSALDRERTKVGVRARALILEFVARELPQSSGSAYSAAELRVLNGRRVSRERFEPYAGSR
ncbi:MAG: hypothetical protein KUG77_03250, partial [Nannocystaceae bacterium]|nr:hypothetical protein [Nannocystaceae bacterium]